MELPGWLSENGPAMCGCGCGSRRKGSFIEKTLRDIVRFLSEAVFSEEMALRRGFLQRWDPRVKVATLIFLLVVINLISHVSLLWIFYAILLVSASLSQLSPRLLIARVWLVIPLFTGIMVLPALFNWVRPGQPVWVIWDFGHPVHFGYWLFPATLAVTKQGLGGGILLVSRVGVSVSLAAVLTLSTRWMDFLRALRSFFIPRIFVVTLEMTYRYIFVLITAMEDMFLARKARDAGQTPWREQRRFVAAAAGGLFGKSLQMSEEVYWSMTARGYTGEIRILQRFRFGWQDVFAFVLMIMGGMIMIAGDRVLGG